MNRSTSARPNSFLIGLAFIGFISLGLPDAVIGVAWPSVRDTFGLRQGAIGLVLVVGGLGYLLSSFCAGRLMQTFGIGLVLAGSTGLVATAMYGFAISTMWIMFVCCALVHGLGSGAIDSGLNAYAAHQMSTRYLIWLHACYCLGALIGPVIMSSVLTRGGHYSVGYLVVGSTMLCMSLLFLITFRSWEATAPTDGMTVIRSGTWNTLRYSAVWLQLAIFFLYTGLEVTFSQWTYTVLTESRHASPGTAGIAVAIFWGCIGTGRILSGLIADRIGVDRLLRSCLLCAATGALLFASGFSVELGILGISLAGLGLAPIFPCLMSRTPQRLGTQLSVHAIGFQVGAAMIGAAAVPGGLGVIAGRTGLNAVPIGTAVLFGILILLHERLLRLPDVDVTQNSELPASSREPDATKVLETCLHPSVKQT